VTWEAFLQAASEQLQHAKKAGTGQIRALQLDGATQPAT
jgi:hypothetical protein